MRGFEVENCSDTVYQPMPRRKQVDVVKRQVSCGTFLAAASRDLSESAILSEDKDGLPGAAL